MDACTFRGEYPFAWIDFECAKLPVSTTLEAYNPFIPSDPDASGIPCAILKYHVKNTGTSPLDVSILWSMLNISGLSAEECLNYRMKWNYSAPGQFLNTYVEERGLKGILFGNNNHPESSPRFGSVALSSPDHGVTVTTNWKKGPWFSSHYHVWNYFKEHGQVTAFEGSNFGSAETGIPTS